MALRAAGGAGAAPRRRSRAADTAPRQVRAASTPLICTSASRARRSRVCCRAAAAAPASGHGATGGGLPPLPAPPATARLRDVMPYLWELALQDVGTRPALCWAFASLVASKSLGLLQPLAFKFAVDALAAGAAGPPAAAAACARTAALALCAAGAARALAGLASEARVLSFTPVAQSAARRVALAGFSHVLSLDAAFHAERRTGSLSRVMERGTRSVAMVFRAVVFTFVPTAVELVAVCALLWRAFSGVVVAIVLATFAAYVAWTVAWTAVAAGRREAANLLDSGASGKAVDALLNVDTVSAFGNGGLEARQYDGLLASFQRAALHADAASCALNAGQAVTLAAGLSAVLSCAAMGWGGSRGTVGDLVMANGLLLQLWAPLGFLGFFWRELRQSLVDMGAMFDILGRPSAVPDGDRPLPPAAPASAGAPPPGLALSLRGVRFSYPGTGREVLRGLSLEVAPGERLGVVGPSGSGKSTLLALLLRRADPTAGAVLFDGEDARRVRLDALRAAVAVVPQDCALFADTLGANVAYGRPGAPEADVAAACDAAQLGPLLASLPAGLGTHVGERGVKLSGGERQRVAIARALLRSPRLLLSDEATSSLDSGTEASVLRALAQASAGRTAVTVAHRLATVRDCDRIVVLQHGLLAEQGTHAQLLRKGGLYAAMWRQQAEEEKKAAGGGGGDAAATEAALAAAAAAVAAAEAEAEEAASVAAAAAAAAADVGAAAGVAGAEAAGALAVAAR